MEGKGRVYKEGKKKMNLHEKKTRFLLLEPTDQLTARSLARTQQQQQL